MEEFCDGFGVTTVSQCKLLENTAKESQDFTPQTTLAHLISILLWRSTPIGRFLLLLWRGSSLTLRWGPLGRFLGRGSGAIRLDGGHALVAGIFLLVIYRWFTLTVIALTFILDVKEWIQSTGQNVLVLQGLWRISRLRLTHMPQTI